MMFVHFANGVFHIGEVVGSVVGFGQTKQHSLGADDVRQIVFHIPARKLCGHMPLLFGELGTEVT